MTTLFFLLSVVCLFVLLITLIVKAIKHKPIKPTLKRMSLLLLGYIILWLVFYFKSSFVVIPLNTDICFDDWCATITSVDKNHDIPAQLSSANADSSFIVLHVKMSNHARAIAQKPSEPCIHIVDERGHCWSYSKNAQRVFEMNKGKQPGLDAKLELNESLETMLIYAIPARTGKLKVLIEEGPFITKLLLPEDKRVFIVP